MRLAASISARHVPLWLARRQVQRAQHLAVAEYGYLNDVMNRMERVGAPVDLRLVPLLDRHQVEVVDSARSLSGCLDEGIELHRILVAGDEGIGDVVGDVVLDPRRPWLEGVEPEHRHRHQRPEPRKGALKLPEAVRRAEHAGELN
jgi:hypothetical protein